MERRFEGKVVVITGAAGGIGRAAAERFAREGASVVAVDLAGSALDEVVALVDAAGARAVGVPADVSKSSDVERYVRTAKERFGGIDAFFNNAGIAFTGSVEQMSFKDMDRVMDVDFWGVVSGTKAFLPYLVESGDGHIINISSIFGLFSVPTQSAYNAAKFAVRAFTSVLRQELLGEPIRVTEIDPGMVETEFSVVRFGGDADRAAKVYEGVTPLSADDVADCIAFAVTRPSHVNIDSMLVMARDQYGAQRIQRRQPPEK